MAVTDLPTPPKRETAFGVRMRRWRDLLKTLLSNPTTFIGFLIIFLLLAMAIFAPFLAPPNVPDPYQMPRDWGATRMPPGTPGFPLGTTNQGGDVLYGVIWGSRTSLQLSVIVVSVTVVIGIAIGSIAGLVGGWIDETAPLTATDPRAEAIIDSENIFLSSVHRATVVRAGGIYGNPKSRLLDRVLRGSLSPAQPLRYTNRIHRDDCAGFLVHLLELAQAGESLEPIYNAVDNLPAPAHDVDRWLAEAMCVTTPLSDAPPHSPPATHKRCRNDALHSSGYSLRYPDYRVGYGELRIT